MNKIILIIRREYITRVRKRSFLITTLLFPLLYMGLIFGTGYLGAKSKQNLKVAVLDSSGFFKDSLLINSNREDSSVILVAVSDSTIKHTYDSRGYDGFVIIPPTDWHKGPGTLKFNTNKTHGLGTASMIENKLNSMWTDMLNKNLGITEENKTILTRSKVNIKEENEKNKNADSGVASTIGYASGFLIYFILLIYGSQVMMGVMEEKTNRIAEVMVSSVKPFQLMLGKIIGISLVALTQFLIWVACIFLVYYIGKSAGSGNSFASEMVKGIQNSFASVNLPLILFCFAFYFMGGFFFYSALYAAIGSAINEDVREAQSLSFPITLLIIFSIAVMSIAIKNPSGQVAVWASIIPFSSPIVMMARLPFGVPGAVPVWQLGLSMALLVAGFLFTTWIASKIYRTGILMYGKKPSWKEMLTWAFRKS